MDAKEVGRRVSAARKRAGIKTRPELAALAAIPHVGPATLGKIERGERPLERHEAPLLARALEVPVAFFYEDEAGDDVVEALARVESRLDDLEAKIDKARGERDDHVEQIKWLLNEQSQLLGTIQALIGTDGATTLQDHLAQMLRDAAAQAGPRSER